MLTLVTGFFCFSRIIHIFVGVCSRELERKTVPDDLEKPFLQKVLFWESFLKSLEGECCFAGLWQRNIRPTKSFEKILKENFFKSFP